MSSHPRLHAYTYAEYLAHEQASNVKHEYLDGEIYAMAGGSPEHASLAMVIGSSLMTQLEGKPCRVFSSDLRVRVLETGLATYPDVTVLCGVSERDPESPTHVTNPKVVVEVLSRGTADYDRGEKREHYQRIASLEAIVIVNHESEQIELWVREGGDWNHASFGAGESVPLPNIGCLIDVDEVYAAARQA